MVIGSANFCFSVSGSFFHTSCPSHKVVCEPREALFSLKNGEFAVLAEVSEDWSEYIDDEMDVRGGQVYRVSKSSIPDSAFGLDYYGYHLYPYYYEPSYYY